MPGKKKLKKRLKRAEQVRINKLYRRMKNIIGAKRVKEEEEKQRELDMEAIKLVGMRDKENNVVPTSPNVFKKERWTRRAKNDISDSSKQNVECGFDRLAWAKRVESSEQSVDKGNGK